MSDSKSQPRKLPEHHVQWWKLLKEAVKNDAVGLMSCGSPDGDRTVICIIQREGDEISFTPLAQMAECENPYDCYTPPNMKHELEA